MHINIIIPFLLLLIFLPILFFSYYEGLQEPPINLSSNILNYDISNIEQIYHPTYIDTNVKSIGGFALPTFYTPNTHKYPNKTYVPNYVDSIYMSSLTKMSNVSPYTTGI